MEFDDIVYLGLLFFSIGFGQHYRNIKDVNKRKNIGTLLGLIIVFIVSGFHIAHTFVSIAVNAFIILFTSKRQCHIISFVFSFLYLFFFRTTLYFGIPYPPAHTNMIQMVLTLKLVGLAFEVNSAYTAKHSSKDKNDAEKEESEYSDINVDFLDIFHYSFNYVGIIAGPYYRYRTFQDSFKYSFHEYAPAKDVTVNTIKYVPLYAVLYIVGSYIWPQSYSLTDEFYESCSWLYRLWYVWPNFFIFRMRIYIGIVLSECVCTMAGLGVYPAFSEPKPGHGPSKYFKKLQETNDVEKLRHTEYNFKTIHNIDTYGSDFCVTFREGMKHWNICVQYWLAVNVYKRFPNKQFRTLVTMLVSSAWHGVYTGYYVCIGCAPFYLPIEDMYVKLFLKDNTGPSRVIWEWIIWISKMFAFSYLAIAFHLLTLPKIWHYYNSVYHAGAIIWVVLYVVGMQLSKARKLKMREEIKSQ